MGSQFEKSLYAWRVFSNANFDESAASVANGTVFLLLKPTAKDSDGDVKEQLWQGRRSKG